MTNEISELVQRLVTCAEGDWSENLAHIPMAMREAAKTLHSISERIDATRAALRTALGEWRMYAEMYETGGGIERGFDIEKEGATQP